MGGAICTVLIFNVYLGYWTKIILNANNLKTIPTDDIKRLMNSEICRFDKKTGQEFAKTEAFYNGFRGDTDYN